MVMANRPFSIENAASRFMFSGPVAFVNGELSEVKGKKLTKGPQLFQGDVSWAAYEDNYFICSLMPGKEGNRSLQMSATDETVRMVLSEGVLNLQPGAEQEFGYTLYFGPKKLSILKQVGSDLSRAINFGWFDALAKPMLWLLNFFYDYIKNYGVAIILLTILIKGAFWPITQKGMKSMKNMQKLQPKVAKLKEKFKDDPQKMNQEMMALYKTYKVNPLGGCLPLFLQIPFFFALYKVLLMSIELRHAPFMLWINDLAAPDRLWIGIDIPFLHGIPVLTLLMGGSMYLQQKMTPTTADPTQARIMQMLPIVFTFMFLNFASGLVLYWFVNNLLSILQQQLINRQTKS
jgi:YidC/Oxa1 family membrane protein insertase